MIKKVAMWVGVILLVVGILGYVPGITNMDTHMLLGIFKVNTLHNIIHVLTGLVAIYVGMTSESASRTYFQVFGVIYALVAVLGFYYGTSDILGVVSSNLADTLLHVVIALVFLYFGFSSASAMEEK